MAITNAEDESVLDYGINEAEVNAAIDKEQVKELDLTDLPIEIDIKNIDQKNNEEFALARRDGFGGSDSSILLGVNPFTTLRELILQKCRTELTKEEKEVGNLAAVRKGNDLEPLVIEKASKILGLNIIKPPHMYKFIDFPYLKMNFDGVGEVDSNMNIQLPPAADLGKYIPVEIKVATVKGEKHYNPFVAIYTEVVSGKLNPTTRPFPADVSMSDMTIEAKAKYYGIPQYYYTQLQQEMMALNAPYGFLAVMFDTEWSVSIFFVWRDVPVQNRLKIEGFKAWQKIEDLKQYPELIRGNKL